VPSDASTHSIPDPLQGLGIDISWAVVIVLLSVEGLSMNGGTVVVVVRLVLPALLSATQLRAVQEDDCDKNWGWQSDLPT
jgi:uncharacterized membrane protein